jgi:hypothetical protein
MSVRESTRRQSLALFIAAAMAVASACDSTTAPSRTTVAGRTSPRPNDVGTILGQVSAYPSGTPAGNDRVSVGSVDNSGRFTSEVDATTDSDGRYTLTAPRGVYQAAVDGAVVGWGTTTNFVLPRVQPRLEHWLDVDGDGDVVAQFRRAAAVKRRRGSAPCTWSRPNIGCGRSSSSDRTGEPIERGQ